MSSPYPFDNSLEAAFIAKVMKTRMKALEAAILEVGLAGGGVVVQPHPNPDGVLIKVFHGCGRPALPATRVEHRVPMFYHG